MNVHGLEGKKMLILGLAREGEATLKFLRKIYPCQKLGLADQARIEKLSKSLKKAILSDRNLITHLGKNYLNSLKNYEIIFKTPGIPEKTLKPYLQKKHTVISQTEIFLEKNADNSIGITGTKGKSTTSSLIYHILKKAGKKTELIGNIGKPVLSFLKKKGWFVIELSSHQLNHLKTSPHIAVFLNIFPEHLDYYNNFNEYFNAKTNITKWQQKNDYFIFNNNFPGLINLTRKTKAKSIPFGLKNKNIAGACLKNGWIIAKGKKIIPVREIPLKGEHNILNAMAASLVGLILKIKIADIGQAIKEFQPLEHRLECFANFKNVDFYNDSIATIPEAAIQAINSLPRIETLMAGGLDRGQNFEGFAKKIIAKKINNLILFPDTGKRIAKEISKIKGKKPKIFFVNTMKEAAKIAFVKTKKYSCVLSPASASFNLFKDYKDRGKQFKKYIKLLIKNGQKH